jgi:hypothetical protein
MNKNYPHIANSLRSEAERNRETVRYLEAVTEIQLKTAGYIDKQFERGDLGLCDAVIEGMISLLGRPAAELEKMAFGRGRDVRVGGL